MRSSLSSAGVPWHTLMGCHNHAHKRPCALPSPSPFHYVMAKIALAMQLPPRKLKVTPCRVGRKVVSPNFFSTIWVTSISCIKRATLRVLRAPLIISFFSCCNIIQGRKKECSFSTSTSTFISISESQAKPRLAIGGSEHWASSLVQASVFCLRLMDWEAHFYSR